MNLFILLFPFVVALALRIWRRQMLASHRRVSEWEWAIVLLFAFIIGVLVPLFQTHTYESARWALFGIVVAGLIGYHPVQIGNFLKGLIGGWATHVTKTHSKNLLGIVLIGLGGAVFVMTWFSHPEQVSGLLGYLLTIVLVVGGIWTALGNSFPFYKPPKKKNGS